jgi:hypothetical protein
MSREQGMTIGNKFGCLLFIFRHASGTLAQYAATHRDSEQ